MQNLNFPQNPQPDDKYKAPNGVTYYWDHVSLSWVILSTESVTKNYVDTRDQIRYRRDGDDFIYGDLLVKAGNSWTDKTNVTLQTDGTIVSAGQSRLVFDNPNGGKLAAGLDSGPVDVLTFNSNYIDPKTTIRFSTEDNATFTRIENEGIDEVILFDVKSMGSQSVKNHAVIHLPNSDRAAFVVKYRDSRDFIKINARGSMEITHSGESSFVVTNPGSRRDPPLTVDAETHKIFASNEYNEALKNIAVGGGNVTGPTGDKAFHKFEEENLLATKGYVDEFIGGDPGMAVVGDNEETTEIMGFWYDGRGLFLKIG